MPGAPRLQGRMGCGVRKRRGVQAALGTYPGARPLTTRWRGFFGTGRSKPHDMGAHLEGQPRERLLRPECANHYTARMPVETVRPTRSPEKSMSEACAGLSPTPDPARQPNHPPNLSPFARSPLNQVVLNGPERAPKRPRNGPSSTHGPRNVSNGPKAEARTHTPNSQPCRCGPQACNPMLRTAHEAHPVHPATNHPSKQQTKTCRYTR